MIKREKGKTEEGRSEKKEEEREGKEGGENMHVFLKLERHTRK